MCMYGDFTSLLQLGVGIGIGLSLFRAPVDFRTARITKSLDNELSVLRGTASTFANRKRRELLDLKFEFAEAQRSLESAIVPAMYFALFGALLNLSALVGASLHAKTPLIGWNVIELLFISVAYYFLILAFLEGTARNILSRLQNRLQSIQRQQSNH